MLNESTFQTMLNSIATNSDKKYATKNVATVTTNGLMSAADKMKLDNIDLESLGSSSGGSSSSDNLYVVYGFELDQSESDPSKMITYIGANSNFTAAQMDTETGIMDYGDWAGAWFIQNIKPVVLKFDGSIKYELNPNDYSKTIDGSSVNITSENLGGNVMVGIPTVWIKIDTDTDSSKPKFYFSNKQVDETYHAYAHTNADGTIIPYAYMCAYNGWVDSSGRLRSLSGKAPTTDQTGTDQITEARANNPSDYCIWDLNVLADRQLITLLLMLIGKNCDTQAQFGQGNTQGYSTNKSTDTTDSYGVLVTGTMDSKGLFYGKSNTIEGVKVFGIEHFWGNLWWRTHGLINVKGNIYTKLTKGTEDGSTAEDYNTDGTGYIKIGAVPSKSGYISEMYVNQYGLFIKTCGSGSATTYYCDSGYTSTSTSNTYFAIFGGRSYSGSYCGCFSGHLDYSVSDSYWSSGAGACCKP